MLVVVRDFFEIFKHVLYLMVPQKILVPADAALSSHAFDV